MTTTAIATSTSAEPRSGWASTSTIGMPATTQASAMSRWRCRSPRSARSARSMASPMASATFISSEGCRVKPPGSRIQRPRPVDRRPERREDGHEPDDGEHVDDGCERPHDAHVEASDAQGARHADADGEQLLERQPGAMGLACRRPHEHDPDEREPRRTDEEPEVEAQPRRARPTPVGARGGQDGTMAERISRHRSTSCAICSTSASTPSKRRVGRSRSTNSTTTRSP